MLTESPEPLWPPGAVLAVEPILLGCGNQPLMWRVLEKPGWQVNAFTLLPGQEALHRAQEQ